MKILSKAQKIVAMGILSAIFVSGCSSTPPPMAKGPDGSSEVPLNLVENGSITFDAKAYNLIVGGTWGHGLLNYNGLQYKFKAKTVGAGYAVGVKKMSGKGTVYNLKKVEDFAGTYYGVKAGATLGLGASGAQVQNSKGVVVDLTGISKGFAVDAAAGLARIVVSFE